MTVGEANSHSSPIDFQKISYCKKVKTGLESDSEESGVEVVEFDFEFDEEPDVFDDCDKDILEFSTRGGKLILEAEVFFEF